MRQAPNGPSTSIQLATRVEAQDAAGKPLHVDISRRVPMQDIATARLQILGFHTEDPQVLPGSTALGPSLAGQGTDIR